MEISPMVYSTISNSSNVVQTTPMSTTDVLTLIITALILTLGVSIFVVKFLRI